MYAEKALKILCNAMMEKGITYEKLANETGITKSVISNWINGENKPSAENLFKVFDTLGYDVEFVKREA